MENRPYESTGRVLALALAFFGGLALLGAASGLYVRLGLELTLMLAAFTAGFAALTWQLDPGVRAYVKRLFFARARGARKPGTPAAV